MLKDNNLCGYHPGKVQASLHIPCRHCLQVTCEWQQDHKLHGAARTGTDSGAAGGMLAAVSLGEHQLFDRSDLRKH